MDSKAGIEFYELMGKSVLIRGNFGDNKLNQIVEGLSKFQRNIFKYIQLLL